jgi:hypothetical protein
MSRPLTAANISSETDERNALLGGKIAAQPVARGLTQAETEKTQVETGLGAAKLPKVMVENELAKIQLDMIKGTLSDAGGTSRLDNLSDRLGLTAPQKELARTAWMAEKDPLKKDEAFMKEVARLPASPEPVRKETSGDSEAAISSKKFLENFRTGGAEKLGSIEGVLKGDIPANVKAWMEKHGLSTGDPEFVSMLNSSLQQVASAATSGGGFFAAGRVDLAKDTTATISQTPLHALIALDETADRKLAKLQNLKMGASPSENTRNIDDAIKHYQDVKAITGSLNSYVVGKGTGSERSVVLFDGNQVDPKTFKKIVEGPKTYEFKGGAHMTGTALIEEARKRNVAPDVFQDQLKRYYGSRLMSDIPTDVLDSVAKSIPGVPAPAGATPSPQAPAAPPPITGTGKPAPSRMGYMSRSPDGRMARAKIKGLSLPQGERCARQHDSCRCSDGERRRASRQEWKGQDQSEVRRDRGDAAYAGTAKDLGVDPTDEAQNREGGKRYLGAMLTSMGIGMMPSRHITGVRGT